MYDLITDNLFIHPSIHLSNQIKWSINHLWPNYHLIHMSLIVIFSWSVGWVLWIDREAFTQTDELHCVIHTNHKAGWRQTCYDPPRGLRPSSRAVRWRRWPTWRLLPRLSPPSALHVNNSINPAAAPLPGRRRPSCFREATCADRGDDTTRTHSTLATCVHNARLPQARALQT